jgi:hypothetical protein
VTPTFRILPTFHPVQTIYRRCYRRLRRVRMRGTRKQKSLQLREQSDLLFEATFVGCSWCHCISSWNEKGTRRALQSRMQPRRTAQVPVHSRLDQKPRGTAVQASSRRLYVKIQTNPTISMRILVEWSLLDKIGGAVPQISIVMQSIARRNPQNKNPVINNNNKFRRRFNTRLKCDVWRWRCTV